MGDVIKVCFNPKKQTEADSITFDIGLFSTTFDKDEYRALMEELGFSEFEIAREMRLLFGETTNKKE